MADLAACAADVAASQARLHVPLPRDRRPTDWERSTAGLRTRPVGHRRHGLPARGAAWRCTASTSASPAPTARTPTWRCACATAGWRLHGRSAHHDRTRSGRPTTLVSVRAQRGNADDALMRRLHGPNWRRRAETGRGRLPLARRPPQRPASRPSADSPRPPRSAAGARRLAGLGAVAWLRPDGRLRPASASPPAPGTRAEVAPDARHQRRHPGRRSVAPGARVSGATGPRQPWPPPLRAVLFDRDGTLVHDVPYNGDPDLVRPVDGAAEALESLRAQRSPHRRVSPTSPVSAAACSAAPTVDAVNAPGRRAARAVRRLAGLPARARGRAVRAASLGPAWCWPRLATLGLDARGLRGGRGHRRRRGGRPRGAGRAPCSCQRGRPVLRRCATPPSWQRIWCTRSRCCSGARR